MRNKDEILLDIILMLDVVKRDVGPHNTEVNEGKKIIREENRKSLNNHIAEYKKAIKE